jgi:hypothetical protein
MDVKSRSVTFRDEHKLRDKEMRVLKRIFRRKREIK